MVAERRHLEEARVSGDPLRKWGSCLSRLQWKRICEGVKESSNGGGDFSLDHAGSCIRRGLERPADGYQLLRFALALSSTGELVEDYSEIMSSTEQPEL